MRSVIPVFTQIIIEQSRCSNSSKEVSTWVLGSPEAASRKQPPWSWSIRKARTWTRGSKQGVQETTLLAGFLPAGRLNNSCKAWSLSFHSEKWKKKKKSIFSSDARTVSHHPSIQVPHLLPTLVLHPHTVCLASISPRSNTNSIPRSTKYCQSLLLVTPSFPRYSQWILGIYWLSVQTTHSAGLSTSNTFLLGVVIPSISAYSAH